MLDFIEGEIENLCFDSCIIVNHGIGYKMAISLHSYEEFIGEERIKIKVYLNVKEDSISLFGFYSEDERKLFLLLLSVTGIGPKVAMSILDEFTVSNFRLAIKNEDLTSLQKPVGIGKKSAERILLELKDKMEKEAWQDTLVWSEEETPGKSPLVSNKAEAKEGLLALGYLESEIKGVLHVIDDNLSLEEILKKALRLLSKN